MSDAHKHDLFCERMTNQQLDDYIALARVDVWGAERTLQKYRFRLDRYEREKARRSEQWVQQELDLE